MSTKVLGIAYGGGHANIVIPVLKALEAKGVDTLFLALTSAIPMAQQAGIRFRSFRDYRHLVDSKRARKLGEPLAVEMHNPSLGIDIEESVYYLGINVMENIDALGQDLTEEALRRAGRHSFLAVEFIKQILDTENCSHLLTTNSPRSEKASLVAGQQLGITSFRVDDLYGVPVIYDSLTRRMGEKMYYQTTGRFKSTPTRSCFLCDFARENFLSVQDKWDVTGVDESNSTVTGQPVFDAVDDLIDTKPTEVLFPHRADFPTVTWAHENGHVDESEVVALLAECFRRIGDRFNLVIKIRANIELDEVAEVLGQFDSGLGNLRVIHAEMDPNVLIWNSDILLGQVSTMLTQAAYMGKPVVILDPGGIRDEPLARIKLAPVVQNFEQLGTVIEELSHVESAGYREFLAGCKRINFRRQGTENLCRLIEETI